MEFHPETPVGIGASASAVVEPAPRGAIDERRVHAALVAACDAVCGLFAADGDDTERWLDIACARLLSVCKPGPEERGVRGEPFGVSGVWAGLIEDDARPEERGPSVGIAGFVDQIERDDVRERVRGDLDDSLLRRRAGRRDRGMGRSDAKGVSAAVGSAGALIEDEHGSSALMIVGVVGTDGRLHRGAGTDPAVRAVCCAMARAAEERVIGPRSRRRRMTRQLSQAEQQVLGLLVEGITEHEIASRLGRSRHTVHDHVRSIYKTLGMSSKTELISLWNEAGRR